MTHGLLPSDACTFELDDNQHRRTVHVHQQILFRPNRHACERPAAATIRQRKDNSDASPLSVAKARPVCVHCDGRLLPPDWTNAACCVPIWNVLPAVLPRWMTRAYLLRSHRLRGNRCLWDTSWLLAQRGQALDLLSLAISCCENLFVHAPCCASRSPPSGPAGYHTATAVTRRAIWLPVAR